MSLFSNIHSLTLWVNTRITFRWYWYSELFYCSLPSPYLPTQTNTNPTKSIISPFALFPHRVQFTNTVAHCCMYVKPGRRKVYYYAWKLILAYVLFFFCYFSLIFSCCDVVGWCCFGVYQSWYCQLSLTDICLLCVVCWANTKI